MSESSGKGGAGRADEAVHRLGSDRRAGEDRRRVHDLSYFENGGVERRYNQDRRVRGEQRSGWVRVTQWSSVYLGNSALQLTASS
jgi:hypothetical protein